MAIFYSAKTRGFYNDDAGVPIPEGAVEISESHRDELFDGQAAGLMISQDANGLPVLVAHQATDEEKRAALIASARQQLQESDVVVLRAIESGAQVSDGWKVYREALRDVVRGRLAALPLKPVFSQHGNDSSGGTS